MRYQSIDVYRGLTIAFMIIVNTPGTWSHIYAPLEHAEWHGCTPTDIVFPSFLYIMGVSMWFSFRKVDISHRTEVFTKIFKRSSILFFIGVLLNKFPDYLHDWHNVRILGVLQRIAVCYLSVACLVLFTGRKAVAILIPVILISYWILLLAFPQAGMDYLSLEGNAVLRLDTYLLGSQHLWKGMGLPFDPEGLLSTLPALVNVLAGWLTGQMIGMAEDKQKSLFRMAIFGIIAICVGFVWQDLLPLNKKLWTSSYAVFTSGISILLFSIAVWIFDYNKQPKLGFIFTVFGQNPLFAYVLSEFFVLILIHIKFEHNQGPTDLYQYIYSQYFLTPLQPELGSFLFALCFTIICWLICYFLYRRNIFFKV